MTDSEIGQGIFGESPAGFTYLANVIEKVGEEDKSRKPIPYSLISAIDPIPGGPQLQDDEIALTSWAADDLQAKIGERVRVTYFAPETTHGQTIERSVELKLAAIIPVTRPSKRYVGKRRHSSARCRRRQRPGPHAGCSRLHGSGHDQPADPPFPLTGPNPQAADDEYWAFYRTPKAYVLLKTGQKLWQSRFGQVTSMRIDASVRRCRALKAAAREVQAECPSTGSLFLPLRRQSEDASAERAFDVLVLFFPCSSLQRP
jgi:hypothetical protein